MKHYPAQYQPAIGLDGTIYVGGPNLYALDPGGTEKWCINTDDAIYSSPVIGSDGTVYAASQGSNLYAVSPDGSKKWTLQTGGSIQASPVLDSHGVLYTASSLDNTIHAIQTDMNGPSGMWPMLGNNAQHTGRQMAVDESSHFVVDGIPENEGDTELTGISVTGDKLYQYKYALDNSEYSEPIAIANDTLIDLKNIEKGMHHIYIIACDQDEKWGYLGMVSWLVNSGVPGDVDNDGHLTLKDAVMTLHIVSGAGGPGNNKKAGCDLNKDGKIGVDDAGHVLRQIE